MSSKSDGKMAEDAVRDWDATESSSKGPLPLRSNTPQSTFTPKGPLFRNLDEAHQAITSRLPSRSASHTNPDTSQPSSPASSVNVHISNPAASAESPLSDRLMDFSTDIHPAHRQRYTPFPGSASTGAEWTKTPSELSPAVSPFASSSSGSNSARICPDSGARVSSVISKTSENENTVEDIYDQYRTSVHMEEPSWSTEEHQTETVSGRAVMNNYSHHSEARLPSLTHCSRDIQRAKTGIDLGTDHWHMYDDDDPANGNHQASLAYLPRVRVGMSRSTERSSNGPLNFSRPVLSLRSAVNSQALMPLSTNTSQTNKQGELPTHEVSRSNSTHAKSTTSHEDPDFVIYGRLSTQLGNDSSEDRACQEGDGSHGDISTARLSTDSDEDPFKYDRGSFTVFLQPSREREVSAALRRVSGASIASASGLFHHSSSTDPPPPPGLRSNNPFVNRLQGYQVPIVNYDWNDGDEPREVKISVRSPPAAHPNSPVQPTIGLSEFVREQNKRHRKDINTLMSDGLDWETVATSVGRFDSNRALASSNGLSDSHPVKFTGSSIADYSDTSSIHVPQFDAFSSSEQILQYPLPDGRANAPYPRTLKESGRPIFLPKPRIHRVNGYLQNSYCNFTDPLTDSSRNSTRSAFVEKLSASIRSRSARKLAQRRNDYLSKRWSSSKFASLDSLSSTDSEQFEGMNGAEMADAHGNRPMATHSENHGTMAVNERQEQQSHRTEHGLLASALPKQPLAVHFNGHNPTHSNQPHTLGSPTLFSFPLISLQEAAMRAATRSEHGDDHTLTSGVGTRKNSSMVSSKAGQRTTPPAPQLAKPAPAHPGRPTSASILGISVADRGYSGYSQGM